ncbi:MAG: PAS domain-containing protein [Dehalococcoidia bacterium]
MAQQELELILLRQLASYLSMPIFLVGSDGKLLYYNEATAHLLGRRYDEAGKVSIDDLAGTFSTTTEDGEPLPSEALPIAIAVRERRPAHAALRFRGFDNVWRKVEVTALPLEGQAGRHLGAVAIFWEADQS